MALGGLLEMRVGPRWAGLIAGSLCTASAFVTSQGQCS
jgi:hypothetical protein